MSKAVKLTFLPENVDGVIDGIRNLGSILQQTMIESARATRGLGEAGEHLRQRIDETNIAVSKSERNLLGLASARMALRDEIEKEGESYQKLKKELDALQKAAKTPITKLPIGMEPVTPEQLKAAQDALNASAQRYDELTRAIDHNEDAIRRENKELRQHRDELADIVQRCNRLRDARNAEAEAEKRYKEAAKQAAEAARQQRAQQRQQEAELRAQTAATRGLYQAKTALAKLMRGDLVGAIRSATSAYKGLQGAMGNGMGALAVKWGIVSAAVMGVFKAVKALKKMHEEYCKQAAEGLILLAGLEQRRFEREHPDHVTVSKDFSEETDAELARKAKTAQGQLIGAKDKTNSKALAYEASNEDLLGDPNDGFWTTGARAIGRGIRNGWRVTSRMWNPKAETLGQENERLKNEFESAEANEKEKQDLVNAAKKELQRREKEKAALDLSLQEQKARDAAYDAAEAAKPGSGRLAALREERAQTAIKYSTAEEGSVKKAKLLQEIYDLDRKITEEEKKQSDLAERQAEKFREWRRGKELAEMDAGDRVKYIEKEIAALDKKVADKAKQNKTSLRDAATSEDKEKMRSLIDQRDAAKKEAEAFNKDERGLERQKQIDAAVKGGGDMAGWTKQLDFLNADLQAAKTDKERLEINKQIYAVQKQIADATEQESKAHAEWVRGRRLEKLDAEKRVQYIEKEMEDLRKQERTPENNAKMRSLVDQRDAAKKEADDFKEKKNDFLHRNDTDAQKMSSIGKELEEAGASGDQAKMLELMMEGEGIAENYQEPMTKAQKRRAAKKAERDRKAATKAARKLRGQIKKIEKDWKDGDEEAAESMEKMAAGGNESALEAISRRMGNKKDKSAQEMAAQLTGDKNGVHSAIQEKNGKLVKLEGQERTNQLLEQVVEALQ